MKKFLSNLGQGILVLLILAAAGAGALYFLATQLGGLNR